LGWPSLCSGIKKILLQYFWDGRRFAPASRKFFYNIFGMADFTLFVGIQKILFKIIKDGRRFAPASFEL
jgi:hypothetical protein